VSVDNDVLERGNGMVRRVHPGRLMHRWCELLDRAHDAVGAPGEGDDWADGYRAGLCAARSLIRKG